MKASGYRAILLSALAAFVAFVVYFPITDTDIWWHLAAAREILSRRAFLYTDPFAYTLDHPPWIDLHWLFQLMAYAVYSAAGAWGIVLAKCAITAASCAVLCLVFPSQRYTTVTAALLALLIYETRYLVLARPIVVTIACIATFFFCFERFRATSRWRFLWFLVPLQLVWTNSQGLFAFGPLIAGAYWLGEAFERASKRAPVPANGGRRWGPLEPRLTLSLGALVATCLVNPYGWKGFTFPLMLFGRLSPARANVYVYHVSENVPLLALGGTERRYLYVVVAVTALVLLSFLANRKNARWPHVFVGCGFGCLAFMAVRNVLPYVVVCAPIIGYNLSVPVSLPIARGMSSRLRSVVRTGGIVLAGFLIAACGVRHMGVVARYPRGSAVSPFRVPVAAVEYLKRNPVGGNMFHSIRYGGYLIWQLYPGTKVFIDGRLTVRPTSFFAEYLAILKDPALFERVAERFNITHALLPTAVFYDYMGLVGWLYHSDRWRLAFTDGSSVLFVRADMYEGRGMNVSDEKDAESVVRILDTEWANDAYIRMESKFYFASLVRFLEADSLR